jgi:hypothetical protein
MNKISYTYRTFVLRCCTLLEPHEHLSVLTSMILSTFVGIVLVAPGEPIGFPLLFVPTGSRFGESVFGFMKIGICEVGVLWLSI